MHDRHPPAPAPSGGHLAKLRRLLPDLLAALEAVVSAESPSGDAECLSRCASVVETLGEDVLGAAPERLGAGRGSVGLRWSWREGRPAWGPAAGGSGKGAGSRKVVLLAHMDTVWPEGTLARWPFEVTGDRATGPGIFDMKAGLVQAIFALSLVEDRTGVVLLVTPDEEVGSPASRAWIEEEAAGADAVLVLEPSSAGALKTGRKGTGEYRVAVSGRAAHAGLEPEKGTNALVELAHQVLAVEGVARPAVGTTAVPTLATAGSRSNVVPASASLTIDVRVASEAEGRRVDAAMRALRPVVAGTTLEVSGGMNRPPMEPSSCLALFDRAAAVAAALGMAPLESVTVGGGSDGNFTAAMGVPTLDGLGAVGDGAHAEGEHVLVSAMPERAALVAGLIEDLLGGSRDPA
ncbi:MAG: M20 family metallopeptidase [Acidimicrobiales bacterium]